MKKLSINEIAGAIIAKDWFRKEFQSQLAQRQLAITDDLHVVSFLNADDRYFWARRGSTSDLEFTSQDDAIKEALMLSDVYDSAKAVATGKRNFSISQCDWITLTRTTIPQRTIYMVVHHAHYYPGGGMHDICHVTTDIDEAWEHLDAAIAEHYEGTHIDYSAYLMRINPDLTIERINMDERLLGKEYPY